MSGPGLNGLRIEPLTQDRIPACWQLRLRALRDHPEAFGQPFEEAITIPLEAAHETLRQRMATASSATFVAVDSTDNLVGMIGFFREPRAKNAHRGNIVSVYVVPEARGLGISSRLLEAVLDHARHMTGVLQIHLTVTAANTIAIHAYERAGFVRYGRVPRADILDGKPIDNDLMVLMLDGYRPPDARFRDHGYDGSGDTGRDATTGSSGR